MDKVKRIDNIEELVPELMRIRDWLLPALEVDPSGKGEFDIVCELEDRLAYLYVAEHEAKKTRRENGGDPAQVAPANNLREGQTGKTKDGRRVVVRNGRWVPVN